MLDFNLRYRRGGEDEESFRYGDNMVGVVAGEGCFMLEPCKRRGIIHSYRCVLSIAMRLDEKELIDQLQVYLGCGNVRPVKRYFRPERPGDKPEVLYTVSKLDDLRNIIIPYFEDHPMERLRAKKVRDLKIWKEAIKYVRGIQNRPKYSNGGRGFYSKWTKSDLEYVGQLDAKLRAVKEYSSNEPIPEPELKPVKAKLAGYWWENGR